MKQFIASVFFSIALMATFQAHAQYCGSSQVHFPACGDQTTYGFGDVNTFPCIIRGQTDSLIIPFKVYQSFTVGSSSVMIVKLQFDSIQQLPCGLCWSTSISNDPNNLPNEFNANESGCIKIAGLTTDAAGAYLLDLQLNVATTQGCCTATDTAFDVPDINAQAGHVSIWIKVADSAGACPDTIITSQGSAHPSCVTGIFEIPNSLKNLTIQPNPMSSEAKVSFTSLNGGTQMIEVMDIEGKDVYSIAYAAKPGQNETTISRNGLAPGIYILSVGNEEGTATRKFIIGE